MMTEPLTGCALSLRAEDLSAWRDGALDEKTLARLGAHIPTCAVCLTRLAAYDALAASLRAIPTPEPSRGFGHNPRLDGEVTAEVETRPVARPIPLGSARRRALTGLGAVAAIILVTVAFAQIFGRLGGRLPTASGTVTSASPTATALPDHEATLPPFKTMSVAAAWGKQGLVASIASTQTASEASSGTWFVPYALLPDGSALLGEIYDPRTEFGQLAEWAIATGTVKPLVSPTLYQLGGIMTDGRYVVYSDSKDVSNCACLSVYDLRAGAVVRALPLGNGPEFLDHGLYVGGNPSGGITITDMATGQTSPFPDASAASQHALLLAYSWPYVVYIPDQNATTAAADLVVRDLATGQQSDLTAQFAPLRAGLLASFPNRDYPSVAVSARAVYIVTYPSAGASQLYAIEGFMTPTPRLLPLASCSGVDCLFLRGANTIALGMRLAGQPAAYLQDEGVAVTYNGHAVAGVVTGHYVIFIGPTNGHEFGPYSVVIYDTNLIPGGYPLIKG